MIGAESGHLAAEASSTGLATVGTAANTTLQGGTKRSGDFAFQFDSGAGNVAAGVKPTFSGLGTIYGRAYLRFGAFPASTVPVVQASGGGAALLQVKCTAGGALQLFQNTTQVGSDSSALSTGTWYRVEWYAYLNAAGDDSIELRIDGTTVASGTGAYWASGTFTDATVGWIEAPGASKLLYADDLALNSTAGSQHNAWCGAGAILLLRAVGNGVSLGSWVDGWGGTSGIYTCLDNTPPAGVGEASASNVSQIENYANSATDTGSFNLRSYTAAGVPSGNVVTAVRFVAVHGEAQTGGTPGAKSMSFKLASNPAEASETIVTAGEDAGFVSTYPTKWRTALGTIIEFPTVTLGTEPVIEIGKRTATTQSVECCLLGALVEHAEPAPRAGIRQVTADDTIARWGL